MKMRIPPLLALAALAACGDVAPAGAAVPADPAAWTIGPIIRGRNYSQGVPLNPVPRRSGGWHIDLPQAPGSVHYVTFRHGPLTGKSRIVLRYRLELEPGARLLAASDGKSQSMITLYFQRAGDNWSGRGRFEAYRWYATFATQTPIRPGSNEIVAPLDAAWTAVERSSARTNPEAFRAAIEEADQVGFVLGGGDGYGHGVFATGRARLVVTSFRVE
ncbi:MAG TPA: hypothetical protein VF718_07250 [Allosphingosinicella sp.]|jgi:hypothetical protein